MKAPAPELDELHQFGPFELTKSAKEAILLRGLKRLSIHHYHSSNPYRNIIDSLSIFPSLIENVADLPFLPARLFKEFELRSVEIGSVYKRLTSSGTTGQKPSVIYLDQYTASAQIKVLSRIAANFLGRKRLPMLIIDSPSLFKSRDSFSARGAGILGFSILGTNVTYALDEEMRLEESKIHAFLERHQASDIFIFGFTSIIWEHLHKYCVEKQIKLPLERGILIHGGGWKKLASLAIDSQRFRQSLEMSCGLVRVHNYYGMVEQTGSIFVECEEGYLHSSNYSDVIIRDSHLSDAGTSESGLVQILSILPFSYPGHSILSEDIGQIFGEDDCRCGRLGKYFKVFGRASNAEIRGCSDATS